MKAKKILSAVLVFALAMSMVLSLALVSEAKTAESKNATISFDAEVVDGYWNVLAMLSLDETMSLSINSRNGNTGIGVCAFEIGVANVSYDPSNPEAGDIYGTCLGTSTVSVGTGTLTADGAGYKCSWNTASTASILVGEQPVVMATIMTNFDEGATTKEDLVALFSNNISRTKIKIANFEKLKTDITMDLMTTYTVDSDGMTEQVDSDYILITPLNAGGSGESETATVAATGVVLTDVASADVEAGQAVSMTFNSTDIKDYAGMNWELTFADATKYAKVEGFADAIADVADNAPVQFVAAFRVQSRNEVLNAITGIAAGFGDAENGLLAKTATFGVTKAPAAE